MSTAQLRNPHARTGRLRPNASRAGASTPLARLDTHTFDPTGADLEQLDPLIPIDAPAPQPRHADAVGVLDKAAAVLKGLRLIVVQLNSTSASVERGTAAASARVSLMLDEAQQRLAELEAQSSRVGAAARERIEKACETAAAVLGHDPRLGESSRPAEGSLVEVTSRAEHAARHADDAVLRLSAMTDRAAQAETRLSDSITEAKRFEDSQSALREAIGAQAESETRLVALRDDLESVAASVRYNLSQAHQVEASLLRTSEQAASRFDKLDRAMSDATEQAAGLVQVARDVGGLVMHAERIKEELAALTAQPGAAPRGMGRRTLLSPPRPREEGGAQSAAA